MSGIFLLGLGVIGWIFAHLFRRIMPEQRAALGVLGKPLVGVIVLASLAAMIYGYRMAEFIPLYSPAPALRHLNNLLALVAVYLVVSSVMGGAIGRRIRHPLLSAVKAWAIAHLLVRGDLASVILFGGLLVWGVVNVIAVNRTEADPRIGERPNPSNLGRELGVLIVSLALLFGIGWVHGQLGAWPFG